MNKKTIPQSLCKDSFNAKARQQSNLLDLIFERLPMGASILDREYRIQICNPTWGGFAVRYAPLTGKPLAPGVGYFEHLPGAEELVLPMFQRVLSGETIGANSIRLESGGVVSFWDIFLAPLIEKDEIIGILNVVGWSWLKVAP